MPIRHIFVGNSGGDIEHDDTALTLNIVTVTQSTKLLLTGGIPDIEANSAIVGCKRQRVDFNTESGWEAPHEIYTRLRKEEAKSQHYRCTFFRIHQSNDAVKVIISSIQTRSRRGCREDIEISNNIHTLTKVVFPVPPSPTVNDLRVFWMSKKCGWQETSKVEVDGEHQGRVGRSVLVRRKIHQYK